MRSLAVPIRNGAGHVVAVLNTGVQTSRVSLDRLRDDILPALLDVQQRLAMVIA